MLARRELCDSLPMLENADPTAQYRLAESDMYFDTDSEELLGFGCSGPVQLGAACSHMMMFCEAVGVSGARCWVTLSPRAGRVAHLALLLQGGCNLPSSTVH